MIAYYLVPLVLMGISGLLMDSHRRDRGAISQDSQAARRFALSRYRRRMAASATIGLVGIALACLPLVPRRPWPMAMYVALLMAGCAWMMLMALADVLASRAYYRQVYRDRLSGHLRDLVEGKSAKQNATDGNSSR